MRWTALRAVLGLLLFCQCPITLACEQPPLPPLPETKHVGDDVARIILGVQRYVVASREYVLCERMTLDEAGGDAAPVSFRSALIRRNNDAIAETEAVLALFTERVGERDLLGFSDFLTATAQECIPLDTMSSSRAITDRVLVFIYRDGTAFLNVLEKTCPGLARYDALAYEQRAGKLCSHGRVFPVSPAGSIGRTCDLGNFLPITPEQASRLVDLTHR